MDKNIVDRIIKDAMRAKEDELKQKSECIKYKNRMLQNDQKKLKEKAKEYTREINSLQKKLGEKNKIIKDLKGKLINATDKVATLIKKQEKYEQVTRQHLGHTAYEKVQFYANKL